MKFQVKMNWWCRFGIHSWELWKETKIKVVRPISFSSNQSLFTETSYSGPATVTITETHQRRSCLSCGRIQTRSLYVD